MCESPHPLHLSLSPAPSLAHLLRFLDDLNLALALAFCLTLSLSVYVCVKEETRETGSVCIRACVYGGGACVCARMCVGVCV